MKSIDVLHKVKEIYILSDFFLIIFIFLAFLLRIHGGLLNEKHIKIVWPYHKMITIYIFIYLPKNCNYEHPYRDKLFGATPEKGWLHLTGYLEPQVAPNSSLNEATRWLRIAY